MALANPGPAADHDPFSSPNRFVGLPAGPGEPRPVDGGPPPRRSVDLTAIAEGFAVSAAGIPELHDLPERAWVLLAVTDLFEAWAIGWPTGGKIDFHDHGPSKGAVVVASGTLTETTVRSVAPGVALITTRPIGPGMSRRFGPGYVHDLVNDGEQEAISVYVYGPRLAAMSYYRLDEGGTLGVVRTELVPAVGPFDTTSDYDPS
jgi:hypothetical protein